MMKLEYDVEGIGRGTVYVDVVDQKVMSRLWTHAMKEYGTRNVRTFCWTPVRVTNHAGIKSMFTKRS